MKYLILISLFFIFFRSSGQEITLKMPTKKVDTNLTFTGTRAIERDDYDSSGHLQIGGYVSVYYAGYSDTSGLDGYQKFPTVSPRKETFGLDIAMFYLKYRSEKFRGITSFQYGDIPQSAWSPNYNNIQEANLGFRLVKGLWLDAGFFRTHIGLESIQPRENIAMSLAVATYFEPYYMSGAKLSYTGFKKITFQLNAFNGFNGFGETNRNKAFGASFVYDPSEKISITFNTITCDESALGDGSHQRLYNNLIMIYRSHDWNMGFEVNYGTQKNTGLKDSTQTASMFSALFALKYRIYRSFAVYGRVSYFQDPDEMLTGPIPNENHQLVGLELLGTTLGFEIRPISNSYWRIEGRLLQTKKDETIFYPYQGNHNQRLEIMSGIGVWF